MPRAPRSFPESQSGACHWSIECPTCGHGYVAQPWLPSRTRGVTTLHFLRRPDAERLDRVAVELERARRDVAGRVRLRAAEREQADAARLARAHAHVVKTRAALFPGAGW